LTAGKTVTYNYDLNGNRISKVGSHPTLPKHYYTFDTLNRLIQTRDGSTNGPVIFEATYDYRTRRLTTLEGGATKYFRYDSGDSFHEVANGTSNIQVEFVRGSGMGGGIGSILYSDRGATREHFTYNAVGHTVALTLQTGAVSKSDLYEAYGNIVASSGNSDNNRLANTKERSFTLGLDNHGFRYYDPEIGRYITRDPIGYADGLNVYLYVHNNPINHIDPLGLDMLDAASNFFAAFADTVTLGLTRKSREGYGTNATVDVDTAAYAYGEFGGSTIDAAITVTGFGGAAKVVVTKGVQQGGKVLAKEVIRNEAGEEVRDASLRLGEEAAVHLGGVDREDARMTRLALQDGMDAKGKFGVSAGGKKPQDSPEPTKVAKGDTHGNSAASQKAQHGYVIKDKDGNVVKTGISGQKLNVNGSPPRANRQVNALNKQGEGGYTAEVIYQVKEGPGARQAALEAERQVAAQNSETLDDNIHKRP
jgi:RHS repeat-associated protein